MSDQRSRLVVRASLDIGSGATKISVAEVAVNDDDGTCKIERYLFEEQTEVLYGHDAKKNAASNTLSDSILAYGQSVVAGYCQLAAREYGCALPVVGVSTAVFRETANGEAFVQRLQRELPLRIHLVTQQEEGLLGFQTAAAASALPPARLLSWDSGGASFQLVRLRAGVASGPRTAADCLVHLGGLGSAKVTAMMVEQVQGKDFAATQSPNPVSPADCLALRRLIAAAVGSPPDWWDARLAVVAIGGVDCMAAIASAVVGSRTVTAAAVADAVQRLCGRTDDELAHLRQPAMVLPKLLLMHTVMDAFGIAEAEYCPSNGCNPALLVSGSYFTQ